MKKIISLLIFSIFIYNCSASAYAKNPVLAEQKKILTFLQNKLEEYKKSPNYNQLNSLLKRVKEKESSLNLKYIAGLLAIFIGAFCNGYVIVDFRQSMNKNKDNIDFYLLFSKICSFSSLIIAGSAYYEASYCLEDYSILQTEIELEKIKAQAATQETC